MMTPGLVVRKISGKTEGFVIWTVEWYDQEIGEISLYVHKGEFLVLETVSDSTHMIHKLATLDEAAEKVYDIMLSRI